MLIDTNMTFINQYQADNILYSKLIDILVLPCTYYNNVVCSPVFNCLPIMPLSPLPSPFIVVRGIVYLHCGVATSGLYKAAQH